MPGDRDLCVGNKKKNQKQALSGGMSVKLNNFCYSVFKKQLSQIVPNVFSKTSVTLLCFFSRCKDNISILIHDFLEFNVYCSIFSNGLYSIRYKQN